MAAHAPRCSFDGLAEAALGVSGVWVVVPVCCCSYAGKLVFGDARPACCGGFNTVLLVTGGMPGLVSMRYKVLVLLDDANRDNSAMVQHAGAELPQEVVELEAVPYLLTDREVGCCTRGKYCFCRCS